jgi:DNA-directed RNA polymerase subunit K/omega
MSDYEGDNDAEGEYAEDDEVLPAEDESSDTESEKSGDEAEAEAEAEAAAEVDELTANTGTLADTADDARPASAQVAAVRSTNRAVPRRPKVDPLVKFMNTNRNIVLIKGEARIMQNLLTKEEAINIISMRATQIAENPNVFAEVGDESDPAKKAEIELYAGKCPLLVRRFKGINAAGDHVYEEWDPKEMALPSLD